MSINQNFPEISPSLTLDFANSKTLDPRITFERSSIGTYVGADGLIKTAAADEARFDHDPTTGESLGLLIEESRTNLWANSSNLTISDLPVYANWNNASRTSNVAVSPDGLTEGDRNTFSTATASTVERFSATAGVVYTFSIYLKKDPTSVDTLLNYFGFIVCWSNNGSTLTSYAFPDLVSGQNASDVLTDEWKRFSVSYTCPAGATSMEFGISNRGAGTATLSQAYSVLCWGAQIEAGSFPTSYIPTSGETVTRTEDNAKIEGTNFEEFFNPNEGTIYSKVIGSPQTTTTTNTGSGYPYIYSIDSSQSNRLVGSRSAGANNGSWSVYAHPPGSFSYVTSSNFNTQQVSHKVGGSYTSSTYVPFADGVVGSSITPGTNTNTLLRFRIGSGTDGGFWGGTIAQIIYYPKRLTDSQLQNLTK